MPEVIVKKKVVNNIEAVSLFLTLDEALYLHAVLGRCNQNSVVGTPYGEETVYSALDDALDRNGITVAERKKFDSDVKDWFDRH